MKRRLRLNPFFMHEFEHKIPERWLSRHPPATSFHSVFGCQSAPTFADFPFRCTPTMKIIRARVTPTHTHSLLGRRTLRRGVS